MRLIETHGNRVETDRNDAYTNASRVSLAPLGESGDPIASLCMILGGYWR
jgi:hypothetical protein